MLIALILRIWGLDSFPSGLNADEAAIGYNDYSLLLTGKDEHGEAWPIHFESFGDFKPGLYFYLVLPFVKIMGLNIWAVRLPSAILGVLSVLGIMFLVKEIFSKKSIFDWQVIITGLFLAVSPWHLQFSRGGWEVNAATTFLIFGCLFLLRGIHNQKNYYLAVIAFALAMYTYHSIRVVAPLIGFGFIVIYFNQIKSQLKHFLSSGMLLGILLLPLIASFLSPAGASRFTGVSFLSQSGPEQRAIELRNEHKDPNNIFVKLIHNRVVTYGLQFTQNYFDHFNGNFLFVNGDVIERNRVPETGQMYIYDFLLIIIGLTMILKTLSKPKIFLLAWLLVAPVAAALTFQTPHALRAQNMVIPLIIISAYGLVSLLEWIKEKKKAIAISSKARNKLLLILLNCYIVIMLSWSVGRYLHEYYIHYPQTYPAAWEYGFDQLVNYIKPIQDKYDKIYVTDKDDQPYILFLFYLKYPPAQFQKEVVLTPRDQFGFSTVMDFSNFHFNKINWDEIKDEKNILVIGTSDEIPNGANIIKVINFPNGQPAFKIVKL